jgi:hypothetical protein
MLELAWSSPQAIAHRLARPDAAEHARMLTEKFAASLESWVALGTYALALQRALVREMLRHRTWGSLFAGAPIAAWLAYAHRAGRGLSAATAPYHRRAGANARRLASGSRRRRKR